MQQGFEVNSIQRDYLYAIRLHETSQILSIISEEKTEKGQLVILEIGAGAGWQSKEIAEHGYIVEAIDIEDSNYSKERIWPVKNYDGRNLPFPDRYFDVVFSSSVLEHISHLEEFQKEMLRVLKPSGCAVHVVPGSNWRFWTSITHYPFIIKTLILLLGEKKEGKEKTAFSHTQLNRAPIITILKSILIPPRHGEIGNSFSELYRFSKSNWKEMFEKNGWKIERVVPNNLFYTGYMLFCSFLSLYFRHRISFFTGSVCHVFVLKKKL